LETIAFEVTRHNLQETCTTVLRSILIVEVGDAKDDDGAKHRNCSVSKARNLGIEVKGELTASGHKAREHSLQVF